MYLNFYFEIFEQEMILVIGKAKKHSKVGFTVVNYRFSRAVPANEASTLDTFLTLHKSKLSSHAKA